MQHSISQGNYSYFQLNEDEMAFDIRMEHDLVQILTAGASITLNSAARPHDSLIRLATAARLGGGQLRLTGIDTRATQDLTQKIAEAGRGHIIFE